MNRDSSRATVGMTELFVGTPLADFDEAQRIEKRDDLARFENRDARHSVHDNRLRADELGFELGFAVIK